MRVILSIVLSLAACGDDGGVDAAVDAALDTAPADAADDGATDAAEDTGPPPPPPDMSCLGTDWWPAPEAATLEYHWRAADPLSSRVGIAGVVGEVYDIADTALTTPLATATTDEMGDASWTLDVGTAGLEVAVRLRGPGTAHKDSYMYRNQPVTADEDVTLYILTNVTYGILHSLVETSPDPTLGTIGLGILACNGVGVPDATVTLSSMGAETRVIYYAGGIPDAAATATDSSGLVAIFGVPAGPLTLTIDAPPSEGADPVTIADVDIEVRADATTVVATWPE